MNFKHNPFPNRCAKNYRTFIKGEHTEDKRLMEQPVCGCSSCWYDFFDANPGKVQAAKMALKLFGESNVIESQGTVFLKAVKQPEFIMEIIRGGKGRKRVAPLDNALIIKNRGEKYLKQLKLFLKAKGETIEVAAAA